MEGWNSKLSETFASSGPDAKDAPFKIEAPAARGLLKGTGEEPLPTTEAVKPEEKAENYLRNGNKLSPRFFKDMGERRDTRIRVYHAGKFAALYDYKEEEQIYKPFKMFL